MAAKRKADKGDAGTGSTGERPRANVVRRPREERKQLSPEQNAFASGDDDALWRRERSRNRLDDPRPVASSLVAGVANRDARLVFEARVKRLRAAIESGDEHTLAEQLGEAVRLGLWRANSVVGFDVFAEAVLGLPADRARALAIRGAAALEFPAEIADEPTVALWMRAESGLLEIAPSSRVSLLGGRLILEVPFDRAAEALSGVGRRAAPMAKIPVGPEVVVDRPRGVTPLTKIIERDRPRE